MAFQEHTPWVEVVDISSKWQILKLEFRALNSNSKGMVCGGLFQLQLVPTHSKPHTTQSTAMQRLPIHVMSEEINVASRVAEAEHALIDDPNNDPLTTPYRAHRKGCTLLSMEQEKYSQELVYKLKVKSICFLTKTHPVGKHLSSAYLGADLRNTYQG